MIHKLKQVRFLFKHACFVLRDLHKMNLLGRLPCLVVITLATSRTSVQFLLDEEKILPFRFFFLREPVNLSIPSEIMFESPPLKAASLYTNQVQALYVRQDAGGFEAGKSGL